jgi:hypothetical protein
MTRSVCTIQQALPLQQNSCKGVRHDSTGAHQHNSVPDGGALQNRGSSSGGPGMIGDGVADHLVLSVFRPPLGDDVVLGCCGFREWVMTPITDLCHTLNL